MNKQGSCLVIKNDGIGDLILTSGIVSEISKIFNGQLDLVTCEQNREIVEMIDGIRKPFYISRDKLRFWPYLSRLGLYIPKIKGNDLKVLKQLKKRSYHTAIVLRRYIRQNTLIVMSFVKARNKYCTWQFPTNTTHKVAWKFSKSYLHQDGEMAVISEIHYFRQFIDKILNTKINPEPKLMLPSFIQKKGEEKNVALAISGQSKGWPIGNWIDFIKGIQSKGYKAFLFGGEEDKKIGKIIKSFLPDCEDFTGKLSFKESIIHLQKMSIMIGNDTGFTHFASLVLAKVIVILGGGSFKRFFPWPGNKNQYIIYYGMPCFDCDFECKYPQKLCINMIRVEDLMEYFDEIMTRTQTQKEKNLNTNSCEYKVAWRRRPWEKIYADC